MLLLLPHVDFQPVAQARYAVGRTVPAVQLVIDRGAQVVGGRPIDGTTVDALSVDAQGLQIAAQLVGAARPAAGAQPRLDDHATGPAQAELRGAVGRLVLLGRLVDL